MGFFLILQSNFQHVLQYESPELQQKARSVIPHQELADAAERGLKQAREADPGERAFIRSSRSYLKAADERRCCVFRMQAGSRRFPGAGAAPLVQTGLLLLGGLSAL